MSETNKEDRMEAIVEDLLRGRRLKLSATDAGDRDAILAAARLAASREAHPRMSAALRRRVTAFVAGEPEAVLLNRRAALAAVAGLAVGAAGAFGIGRLGEAPSGARAPAGILKPAARLGWVTVGALADFPDGKATEVVAGTVRAYIFRRGESLSAVSSICSDQPCALDWRESNSLYCPCHRQVFSSDGVPAPSTHGYSVPRLTTYQVKLEGGQVRVLAQ